jgi:hypothetical protein
MVAATQMSCRGLRNLLRPCGLAKVGARIVNGRSTSRVSCPSTLNSRGHVLRSFRSGLLALFTLAVAPIVLLGQDPAPPPQASPEVQEWLAEIQALHAQLGPIEAEALQDPELREEQQQVTTAVQAAMAEIDPTIPTQIERMNEIQAEAQEAQEAGDIDRVLELTAEAQQIQQSFAEARLHAVQRPELAPRVEEFQARVQERMIQIDPDAAARIERLQELQRRITAATDQPQDP